MWINQVINQQNVIFVIIGIFLDKNFTYQLHLSQPRHDLMQKAMSFNNVAIVSIKGSDYRIHFWYMSTNDAVSTMHNSNLSNKKGTL